MRTLGLLSVALLVAVAVPSSIVGAQGGAGAPLPAHCRVAATLIVGELARFALASSPARAFARPKSSTFTLPSGVTLTLAGLRSR